MKIRRLLSEAGNLIVTALLALPVLVLFWFNIWKEAGLRWGLAALLPVLIGCVSARVFHTKTKVQVVLLAALPGFLIPGALTYLITSLHSAPSIAYGVISGLLSVSLMFYTRLSRTPASFPKLIVGFIGYFIVFSVVQYVGAPESVKSFLSSGCLLFFVCSLFYMNVLNLQNGTRRVERGARLPAGMRRGNLAILSVFTLITLAIIFIDNLKRLFMKGFVGVIWLVMRIMSFLGGLFLTHEVEAGDSPGEMAAMRQVDSTQRPEWLDMLYRVLTVVVVAIVIALALFLLYKVVRRLIQLVANLLETLSGRMHSDSSEGYVDESENLFSWKLIRQQSEKRLKEISDSLKRPERFDQQPDNRAKVRFVYKRMLEESVKRRPDARFKTPDELLALRESIPGREKGPELDEFFGLYKTARYDCGEISDRDTQVAKQVLSGL